jgi:hypothetical protein
MAEERAGVREPQVRGLVREPAQFAAFFPRQPAVAVAAGEVVHPGLDLRRQAAVDVRRLVRGDRT